MKHSRIFEITASNPQPDAAAHASAGHDDDAGLRLFDALRSTFHTSPRRQFGVFDPDQPEAALAVGARRYADAQCTAEELGLQLARQFQQALLETQSHPWHLWFIVETNGDHELLYLFLLKHDASYHIDRQQRVVAGGAIDTSHLQYAAKLNLGEWRSADSKTYLCYLSPKSQHPVTNTWRSLVGFSEGVDRVAETEKFLQVLDSYAEALPPEKEHDYRERVVNYCRDQERSGQPVELQALSQHVDEGAPDALLSFLTERIDDPTPALYTDRNQLKRYIRLYGRDQDLSISFSTAMLGRHITYDENDGTLTIRSIPKSLRAQLAKYKK